MIPLSNKLIYYFIYIYKREIIREKKKIIKRNLLYNGKNKRIKKKRKWQEKEKFAKHYT